MDPAMRLFRGKTDKTVKSGFTLLELLISMMILAVVITLVFAAFRVGVRAWEKGEQGIDVLQRYRIVLDLMQAQLTSARITALKRSGVKPLSIGGDDHHLTLVSSQPVLPGDDKGLVAARYTVETDSAGTLELVIRETPTVMLNDTAGMWDFDDIPPHVLISGAADISFSYLAPPNASAGSGWLDSWDPASGDGSPVAVKITIEKTPNSPPVGTVARILPGGR